LDSFFLLPNIDIFQIPNISGGIFQAPRPETAQSSIAPFLVRQIPGFRLRALNLASNEPVPGNKLPLSYVKTATRPLRGQTAIVRHFQLIHQVDQRIPTRSNAVRKRPSPHHRQKYRNRGVKCSWRPHSNYASWPTPARGPVDPAHNRAPRLIGPRQYDSRLMPVDPGFLPPIPHDFSRLRPRQK